MSVRAFSVVAPAYNDADKLPSALSGLETELIGSGRRYEIVIVDDGSSDGTAEILKKWEKRHLRVYFHKKNQGMAKTFRQLNSLAKNPVVVQFSLDGEWNPSDVIRLIETMEKGNLDLAIGVRNRGNYGVARKLISYSYRIATKLLFGIETYDAGSIKATKLSLIKSVPIISEGVFEEAERIIRATRLGYRIGTVPVHYQPARKAFRLRPKVPLIIQSCIDLARAWWALNIKNADSA